MLSRFKPGVAMLKSITVSSLPHTISMRSAGLQSKRFERAAFLLAGANVDGRIKRPGQRPDQQQEGQNLRPQRRVAMPLSARSRSDRGRTARRHFRDMPGREVFVPDLLAPAAEDALRGGSV